MNDARKPLAGAEDEARITLGVLGAVEANSAVTQRSVARDVGIALGLANAYLKRCARKGLIKITQVPANRYAYYLTPKGFAEKSRLTAEYLTASFDFFRAARADCASVFAECERRGWVRIALAGAGDLGAIATLCAADHEVRLAGFVDPAAAGGRFAGLPVVATLDALGPLDGIVVTDFRDPQGTFDALLRIAPTDTVLAPALLRISQQPPTLME